MYVTPPGSFARGRYEDKTGPDASILDTYQLLTLPMKVEKALMTTPEFRQIHPESRGCYYGDEVDLGPIFPTYTQVQY